MSYLKVDGVLYEFELGYGSVDREVDAELACWNLSSTGGQVAIIYLDTNGAGTMSIARPLPATVMVAWLEDALKRTNLKTIKIIDDPS